MLDPIFLDNTDSIARNEDQFQPYGQEFLPIYTQSTDQNILIQQNLDEAYKSLTTELISLETNLTNNNIEKSYRNIEAAQENNEQINQHIQDDSELRDKKKSIKEFIDQDDQNYQIDKQLQQQLPDIVQQRLVNEQNLQELQIQGTQEKQEIIQFNVFTYKSNAKLDEKIESNKILYLNTLIKTKMDSDSDEQIIEENSQSHEQIQREKQNQCLDEFDEFDEFEQAQSAPIIQEKNNEIIQNKIQDGQDIFDEFEEAQFAPIIQENSNEIIKNKIQDGQNGFEETQSAQILQDNEVIFNKNLDDSILIEEFEVSQSAPIIQAENSDITQSVQIHQNEQKEYDQVQQAMTIDQNNNLNGDNLNQHQDDEIFDEFEEAQQATLYNDNANKFVQASEISASQMVQSNTVGNNENDDYLDEFDEFEEAKEAEIQTDNCSNTKINNQEDEFDEFEKSQEAVLQLDNCTNLNIDNQEDEFNDFDEFEQAQQEIKNEQIPNPKNGINEELKHSNYQSETNNQSLNLLSKNESQIKALFGQFVQFREITDQFVDANEFEEKISSYHSEFCTKMQKKNFWNDVDRVKKPYRSTWKDFQMKGMVYAALGISEMELVHLDRTPAQTETEIRIPKQNHHHHQSSVKSMQQIKKDNYPHPAEQDNPIEKILQSLPDYSFIFNNPSLDLLQKIIT